MKKTLIILLIAFSFFLLTTFSFAQEEEGIEASPSPKPKVEYELPYPGILPDHPLYILKVLRDRILGFLIMDPVEKVKFNLLMADKRLYMGIFLVDKGKPALAETTVSKGEKYFLKAIERYEKGTGGGREMPKELREKLKKASLKHEEVILGLLERVPDEQKVGLNTSLELVKEIQKRLE